MNHVAGLLTCFLFGFLPIPNEEQDKARPKSVMKLTAVDLFRIYT